MAGMMGSNAEAIGGHMTACTRTAHQCEVQAKSSTECQRSKEEG